VKKKSFRAGMAAVLVVSAVAMPCVFADPPEWAGKGKGAERHDKGKGHGNGHRGRDDDARGGRFFSERQRIAVRDYYGEAFRAGGCPPGLARKNNGCMPPGQAKKWAVGRPLPRDVVYYPVPQALIVRLGRPPAGHEYVRVAGDILMITVGTAIVVDALRDLGR
jgi:Ni/Co efflux regulator RcnB